MTVSLLLALWTASVPAPDGVETMNVVAGGTPYTFTWDEADRYYFVDIGNGVWATVRNIESGRWVLTDSVVGDVGELDLPIDHHPFYAPAWADLAAAWGFEDISNFASGAPSGWTYGGTGYGAGWTWNGFAWTAPTTLTVAGLGLNWSTLIDAFADRIALPLFSCVVLVAGLVALDFFTGKVRELSRARSAGKAHARAMDELNRTMGTHKQQTDAVARRRAESNFYALKVKHGRDDGRLYGQEA